MGAFIKILIAEDEAATRLLLKKILVDLGYEVVECADGQEAWNILSSGSSPELCIFDWMMPGVEGPDLCKFSRGLPNGQNFYLILLTTRYAKQDIARGLGSGANDYILKPFSKAELSIRLEIACRYIELRKQLNNAG